MRPYETKAHLTKAPVQPIRIVLSDGSFYDVGHPEIAAVSRLPRGLSHRRVVAAWKRRILGPAAEGQPHRGASR